MVTYQAPGVYVEEVAGGSRPIQGVGTSVAAFVGFTEKGPVGRAVRVTNWTQYQDAFGGFTRNGYTPLAVYGFFQNGGGNCYVIRVGGDALSTPAQIALTGRAAPQESLRFTAKLSGSEGNDIRVEISDEAAPAGEEAPEAEGDGGEGDAGRFRVTVSAPGQSPEVFGNLSLRRGDERYVVDVVNAEATGSIFVQVEDLAPRGVSLANRLPETGSYALAEGGETVTALAPADFQGDVAAREGIEGLEVLEDVTMIAIPDLMRAYQDGLIDMEGVVSVQKGLIAHCERMQNRVAIIDAPPGLSPQEMENWRTAPTSPATAATASSTTRGSRSTTRRRRAASSCRPRATSRASGRARTPAAASTRRRPMRSCSGPSTSRRTSPRRSWARSTCRA